MRFAPLVFLLLSACPSRAHSPPDATAAAAARPEVPPSATHVCFGPGGSAVEVDRATSCASLGGSEAAPMEVPRAPAVRRDGGTVQPW
ncbi:MAG: hypothetical protein JWM10_4961 [Myxococcaceae bacterium]|nr:hypothetical protein [Myxococcaceae bacterium]